jgi:hypothetical protein
MILTLTFDDNKESDMEKFEMMYRVQDLSSLINDLVEYLAREKHTALNEERQQAFDEVQGFIGYQIECRDIERFLKGN